MFCIVFFSAAVVGLKAGGVRLKLWMDGEYVRCLSQVSDSLS